MIQLLAKLYEGGNLSGATTNVIYVPIIDSRTLTAIKVKTDENVISANAVFELRLNGVVISGAEAVTISVGNKIGTVSGLSVALAEGDELVLNLLSGGVSAPVSLFLTTTKVVNASEITEVTNYNFVTDAESAAIGELSAINGLPEKTTPHANDWVIIEDSEASNARKKVKKSNLGGGGGSYDGGMPSSPLANFYFREDFMGGSWLNGTTAARWQLFGSAIAVHLAPVANHPGILRAGAANSNAHGVSLTPNGSGNAAFMATEMFDLHWVFRPVDVDSDTIFRAGIGFNGQLVPPDHGIYIEKLNGETTMHGVCRASTTQTRTSSLATAAANTWYMIRIRRIDASTIGFTLNGGSEVTVTTNIPTAAVYPFIYVSRPSGSGTKSLDIDYFDLSLAGLTRY